MSDVNYSITFPNESTAALEGTLRLESPSAYDKPFEKIQKGISSAKENYTLDISGVTFLNSSGITAIARLLILARSKNIPLIIKGKDTIPWQRKSITSLQKLWQKVTIQFI